MPRPKPPEPLIPRAMRLTDAQHATFMHLGGSEWLRKYLDKQYKARVTKKLRNDNIRRDRADGVGPTALARMYGLHKSTIQEILR